jgi:hypothetical protein
MNKWCFNCSNAVPIEIWEPTCECKAGINDGIVNGQNHIDCPEWKDADEE